MFQRNGNAASAPRSQETEENASPSLIKAIGVGRLTGYFEYLDDLRESGKTNMYGAGVYLKRKYPGMSQLEVRAVLGIWMKTFSLTLPAEDRAENAIEANL